MTTEIPLGAILYPDGCDPEHFDAHSFQIKVEWRGRYSNWRHPEEPAQDWYAVEHMSSSLSRAGNWAFHISRFQYPQYRHSLEEALEWARKVVNDVKVAGHTFAEWHARDQRIKEQKQEQA